MVLKTVFILLGMVLLTSCGKIDSKEKGESVTPADEEGTAGIDLSLMIKIAFKDWQDKYLR